MKEDLFGPLDEIFRKTMFPESEDYNFLLNRFSNREFTKFERDTSGKLILTGLDLGFMKIGSLPEDLLHKCIDLKVLHITNNTFSEVPPSFLKNLPKLISITFASNQIKSVPNTLFNNNHLIEDIVLEETYLSEIPEKLFENSKNLRSLILIGKYLRLPPTVFVNLSNLTYLKINNHLLTLLPGIIFDNCLNLHLLKIRAPLKSIPKSFNKLQNLEYFYIENPETLQNYPKTIIQLIFSINEQYKNRNSPEKKSDLISRRQFITQLQSLLSAYYEN